jgi:hypothetical protein
MRHTTTPKQKAYTAALLATLLGLAGCGGGGETTTVTTTIVRPPAPPVTTVQGSGGDLRKLANATWFTTCNITQGVGGTVYARAIFQIGALAGTTVPATLTVPTYTDSLCTAQQAVPSRPTTYTISYVKEVVITSDSPPTFQGTADQMSLGPAPGSNQTSFFTYLPSYMQLMISSSSNFTRSSLTYTK